MAPLRPGQIAPSQDNPEASVDTHTQDSLRGQASVCSQMTEEGPCHDLNMEEAGWARAGPGGGEEGWVPAGLAYPWPSWGTGGPPGDGVKLPFSTEGLLLEGAFRAQRGGVSGRPGHVLPRPGTLLTTCSALVARTGTRQAWGMSCLKLSCSAGAGGPFRPVTGPFWGQTKGTSSQQQRVRSVRVGVRESVCVCMHPVCVCLCIYEGEGATVPESPLKGPHPSASQPQVRLPLSQDGTSGLQYGLPTPAKKSSLPAPQTRSERGRGLSGLGLLAFTAAINANDFPRFGLDNLIICSAFILSKVDDK